MITRDPLSVPYRTDKYWIAVDRPPADTLARFEREVLGKAWKDPLPRISHLTKQQQVEAEDENVRRSVKYAKDSLENLRCRVPGAGVLRAVPSARYQVRPHAVHSPQSVARSP